MGPAFNYKALLYATPTHLPSICPFTRPHVIISALSMHLPPVLWAWIRAPATHFLGARILTTLPLSIPPAAFSALPQHLPSPFSVIILSSQYLFQRGPIWILFLFLAGVISVKYSHIIHRVVQNFSSYSQHQMSLHSITRHLRIRCTIQYDIPTSIFKQNELAKNKASNVLCQPNDNILIFNACFGIRKDFFNHILS